MDETKWSYFLFSNLTKNDYKHLPSHLILHLPPILPLPQYVLSFIWKKNVILIWTLATIVHLIVLCKIVEFSNRKHKRKLPEINHSFDTHVRMHLVDILIFFSYQSYFQPRSYTSLYAKFRKKNRIQISFIDKGKFNANHLQLDSIVRLNLCLSTSSRAKSHFRNTLALTVAKQIIVTNKSAVCDAI